MTENIEFTDLFLDKNHYEMVIDPTTALVCLVLLGALVVLLNTISLFIIIKTGRRKGDINYSLAWILVANIFIGAVPLPIYGLKKYEFASLSATTKICDAWRYTYFVGAHIAMASLLILTFEKIISIKFPLRSIHIITTFRLNLSFLLTWLFFIVFDMIPFFPTSETDSDGCHYVVKKEWAITMNILTMAIPLPLIVLCYIYIVGIACSQALRIRNESDLRQRKASVAENIKCAYETKATKKVTYIIGAYILCWLPSTCYYLLVWVCPSCYPTYYEPHKTWIRFFFKLLVMFNGIVTPLLFCWQSGIFRSNANKILKKYRKKFTRENGDFDYVQNNSASDVIPNEPVRNI